MPGLPQLDDMEGPEKTVRSYLLEWEAPMYLREPFVVAICTARFNIQQFYFLPHTVYLCVLCGSENKQRLFPYTALTDWFV